MSSDHLNFRRAAAPHQANDESTFRAVLDYNNWYRVFVFNFNSKLLNTRRKVVEMVEEKFVILNLNWLSHLKKFSTEIEFFTENWIALDDKNSRVKVWVEERFFWNFFHEILSNCSFYLEIFNTNHKPYYQRYTRYLRVFSTMEKAQTFHFAQGHKHKQPRASQNK